MKKINIGVIGPGDIAHIRYFPSFKKLVDEVELIAVCDINPEKARLVGEEFDVAWFTDVDDFLALPELDAVVLTTYHTVRTELIIKILAAGKHLLVEKPFTTRVEELSDIKAAAQASDKVFMVLPYNNYPYVDLAKQYIEKGIIGEVCLVEGTFAHDGPNHAPWFFNKEKAHWGVMADLGIYLMSTFLYMFGPAKSLSGNTSCLFPNRTGLDGSKFAVDVEDNCAAILEWDNGMLGIMKCNWNTGTPKSNTIWEMAFYGSNGVIYLDMTAPKDKLVVFSPSMPVDGCFPIEYRNRCEGYYAAPELNSDIDLDVVKSFVNAIHSGTGKPCHGCSLKLQSLVIDAIDKLYRSAELGITQQLS